MRRISLLLVLLVALDAGATWRPFSDPRRIGPSENLGASVVASNGFDFLAGWLSLNNTNPGGVARPALYTNRIESSGTVYGTLPTPLDEESQFPHGMSLIRGRDGYFAAWVSEKGMRAAILDSFGRPERTVTVPQPDEYRTARTLSAWDGSTYAVLSGLGAGDAAKFSATLLDNNGAVTASGIPIGDSHGEDTATAIVADSAGFLVLSTRRDYSANRDDIYGRRLTPSGSTGDWFLIRPAASVVAGIAAVEAGTHDAIVWSDQFGIWLADYDPQTNGVGTARQLSPVTDAVVVRAVHVNGVISIAYHTRLSSKNFVMAAGIDGEAGVPVEIGDGSSPDIAAAGTRLLSVRTGRNDAADVGNGVIGKFIAPTGADFVVSRHESDQLSGTLVSNGSQLLAVWSERLSNTAYEIYAARFDSGGRALDGPGVRISSTGVNNYSTAPAAAFNGHDWLIVWQHYDQQATTVARRFSSDGRLLDSEDIVLGPSSGGSRSVASDGTNWLVVWSAPSSLPVCGNFGSAARVLGSRVSPDGVVLDRFGKQLSSGSTDQIYSDVAFDGSKYVATWTEQCSGWHSPTYNSVSAAFVTPDLSRIDVFGISGGATTVAKQFPKVVSYGGRSLVAWTERLGSSINTSYRLIGSSSVPQPGRVRAVGTGGSSLAGTAEGSLVGTSADADGTFLIVTQKPTEWVAEKPQGLFLKRINGGGVQIATGFAGLLGGTSFPGPDEWPSGNLATQGSVHWFADSWFDLRGGGVRLWMRSIE